MTPQVLEVEGRRVALSNLDKVLWPEAGFTKGEMLDYYTRVASALLPHVRQRPLSLRRFPDGVEAPNWYQNECRGRPQWLPTLDLPKVGGAPQRFCLVNDLPALLWVVNLATIELHPFLAYGHRPEEPTAAVFDLDPGQPADVVECCRVALHLRAALDGLGLSSFPKTSGAVGLHVYVPLNTPHRYSETKAFARTLAAFLAQEEPELVVDRQARRLRGGKVLVDWLQNDPTRSTVAAYSLRGTAWPTVSTPVSWDEVGETAATGRGEMLTFTPERVLPRLEAHGDLFAPVLQLEQALPQ